jgi:DNA-binding beta-propeller fold protein YncE
MRAPRWLPVTLLPTLAALGAACSARSDAPEPEGPALSQDVEDYLDPPLSCALTCGTIEGCEPNGYQCPALAPWAKLPHAEACEPWDGTYPEPTPGKCSATPPTGDAAKRTGVDPEDPKTTILPTGYRARPAGESSAFTDFAGQFPANVVPIPDSDLVIVVDGGIRDQSVRLVDTTKIGSGDDPVVGREKYAGSSTVNYGAVVLPLEGGKRRVYVSGGAGSALFAFDVDLAARTLSRVASADVAIEPQPGWPRGGGIGGKYMIAGLALSPNGRRIVATSQNDPGPSAAFVIDATTRTVEKRIPLSGGNEVFTAYVHPSDTDGRYAWVSLWDTSRIDVVDLDAGAVIQSIAVGKAPQAIAALGPRYLAVVSADADAITVIDTLPTGGAKVLEVEIERRERYGFTPNGVAYDDVGRRLYVTLGGVNAVAAFEVGLPEGAPPTLAPLGMLPTEWWPTAVAVRPTDRAIVVVNGKGRGTGANPIAFGPGEGDITTRMRGSIQLVGAPDAAALEAGKRAVDAATDLAKLPGASKVECGGAPYDFPIPQTNGEGPSKQIKRIVFIVKENKTFDAVFGDLPGVDGDPKLVMAPGQMDDLFGNQRKIAKAFTNFENYYTSAEQSLQGHVWTAFGRTTDFIERTWLIAWGRSLRNPTMGVQEGIPLEGSLFDWLQREGVLFDNMGEAVGVARDDGKTPRNCCFDGKYPGLLYAQEESDARKACYVAGKARVLCDLRPFTYALQPNDHTSGGAANLPTVQTYLAVGDEGTGLLLHALSHGPTWKDTLYVVTMDDPQDGGDHVDAHRTPLLFAGAWVKRGYVSKGHYDTSSVHKLFAHVFGKPYPNEIVARAALPLDAFTSTPDYTPYEYIPRKIPTACNPSGTKLATEAAMSGWDLSKPDQAPGIAKQIWEILHDGAPPPEGYGDDDDD